jgi:hypothetical protein
MRVGVQNVAGPMRCGPKKLLVHSCSPTGHSMLIASHAFAMAVRTHCVPERALCYGRYERHS